MAYRDDGDALRARVTELERELSTAHAELARLRGQRDPGAPGDHVERSALLGATRALRLARELPHPLPTEGFEALAALARRHGPLTLGDARQVGRHLSIPVVGGELRVETDEHRTRIELVSNLGRPELGALVVAGTLGWMPVLLGSGAVVGALSDPLHAVWAVPATLSVTLAGVRELFRRAARRNERGVLALFEQAVDVVDAHAPHVRARVDVSDDAEDEDTGARPAAARGRCTVE